MNCIVTAGPTYEPLDDVRRLTNFSTGRLGSELAAFLSGRGHSVTLLLGEQASHRNDHQPGPVQAFSSTDDLRVKLQTLASGEIHAIFHAAAVSDYKFGRVWVRAKTGDMVEVKSGKISTRDGALLAELLPTPKIISGLREWFPKASIVGWKYEVEGARAEVIDLAARQIAECKTDRAVANGPAYGEGFGLVAADGRHEHLPDRIALFNALEKFLRR